MEFGVLTVSKGRLKVSRKSPGPQNSDDAVSPCDVFYCIFPECLIQHLVYKKKKKKKLYACQKAGGSEILGTNVFEMKKFLAANMMMGIKT